MRPDLDPELLTPDDRRTELAVILARGLLRFRDRHILSLASAPQTVSESRDSGLSVQANTWPHVTTT
jgi:hypothetical protein